MSELVGRILKDLYDRNGFSLLQDPPELQKLLEDLCPDENRATRLILLGLSRQVPHHLLNAHPDLSQVMQALKKELHGRYQMHPRFSQWIVETWGSALGLLPLSLEPRNIFAEAEAEYRLALRAALTSGLLTAHLQTELHKLQDQLLLSPEDAERIRQEVQQELQRHQEFSAPPPATQLLSPPQHNSLGMAFMRIEAGSFLMGSPVYERHRENDELQHPVVLTRPYYLQTTPVTQQQWEQVMGSNPSDFKGPALPVENISWNDIVTRFLPRLNQLGEGQYRLPTEAEWEYATRAGSSQAYGQLDDPSELDSQAWYTNNSEFQTHAVGQKKHNPWGLYDMHGNIWEWCQDWYNGAYEKRSQTDPTGPLRGLGRVMRGGSWFCNASACRSAARGYMPPETRIRLIGFRLVREADHLLETPQ
ncbi:MAG: formylglycine-generating enzyme family protein [Candidatus Sericytochromatia bacterium]